MSIAIAGARAGARARAGAQLPISAAQTRRETEQTESKSIKPVSASGGLTEPQFQWLTFLSGGRGIYKMHRLIRLSVLPGMRLQSWLSEMGAGEVPTARCKDNRDLNG